MHPGAMDFLSTHIRDLWTTRAVSRVLEIGSRDINGSPRGLFGDDTRYVGIDVAPGLGVDVIASGATFHSAEPFDLVVCAEVAEHTPEWPDIVRNAARLLTADGVCLLTAASGTRAPHSAHDGGPLRDGEYYANVDRLRLHEVASQWFRDVTVSYVPHLGDVYLRAATPRKSSGDNDL